MASTAKAIAFRDEFASQMLQRLPALAQTKGFASADSAPTLRLGTGVTATDSVFIKFTPIAMTNSKDVLGLTETVFTPHIAQVVVEANYEGATDTVLDTGTWATRLTVLACLAQSGIRIELYLSANGTGPSVSGITGAPSASFENHVQYPQMASL